MTNSKQTREQWLDKHEITDEALRAKTLENFDTRDELQAYITKMQRPGFAVGDPFDIDDLLMLPQLLGFTPAVLMTWRGAVVHERALISLFSAQSDTARTEVAVRLVTELEACISAEVPPEYIEQHMGGTFGWGLDTLLSTWSLGLSHDDLRTAFLSPAHRGAERGEDEASSIIADAVMFRDEGVPYEYLRSLPEQLASAMAVAIFRIGADADAVKNRLGLDPDATGDDILREVVELSAEYWNLVNRG